MSTLILGFTISDLILAVLGIPLVSGLINGLIALVSTAAGRPRAVPLVTVLGIGAPVLSLLIMGLMVFMLDGAPEGLVVGPYFDSIATGLGTLDVAFWLDPLSFTFGLIITLLVVALNLFVVGDEPAATSAARHSALLNLGLAFSLMALWAESLPVFFFGWEGTAIIACLWFGSFVFWSTRMSAVVFLLGIIGLMQLLSNLSVGAEIILSFASLADHAAAIARGPIFFLLIPALIFAAQLPFSVWLWRAGHGNSIALAWISVAALPTLAIYLLARIHFLSLASPLGLFTLEMIGAVTAVIAAYLACFQDSIRRVIAYFVVSQAGFVVAAFGIGAVSEALWVWVVSGIATVLLICAVTTLIRWVGEDKLSRLGGYGREFPWVLVLTSLACLSLIGIPPFGVFLSRFEILWQLLSQERYVTWGLLTAASIMIAVTLSRLWVLTFLGARPEAYRAPVAKHFSWTTLLALGVLVGALITAIGLSGAEWLLPVFEDYLPIRSEVYGKTQQLVLAIVTFGSLLIACGTTIVLLRRQSRRVSTRVAREDQLIDWLLERLFLPLMTFVSRTVAYQFLIEKVQRGVFVDGLVGGLRMSGRGLLRLHSGCVQHYLFWLVLGTVALIAWIVL